MSESTQDPMQACDGLAEPMGQLAGGAAAVGGFAGGFLAGIETGPGAVVTGAAAGYGAYTGVRDVVTDNWHDAVCQPLSDYATPAPEVGQDVFSGPTDPFSAPSDPFSPAPDAYSVAPAMTITDFGDSGTYSGGGSTDFGSGSSGGGDSGGGDSGGSD